MEASWHPHGQPDSSTAGRLAATPWLLEASGAELGVAGAARGAPVLAPHQSKGRGTGAMRTRCQKQSQESRDQVARV